MLITPLRVAHLLLLSLLWACSSTHSSNRPTRVGDYASVTELTATPFFPQEDYQCGPAALATVLVHAGVGVSPEALLPQVYLSGRYGTLQVELLAATRRHGRIAFVIPPDIEHLSAELRAGHPVLVLQNLGLSWLPQWHYAVVIGIDLAQQQIILRSGTYRRHTLPLRVFERTWRRADNWGFVALTPGDLPAADEPLRVVDATAQLAKTLPSAQLRNAYTAAAQRWPNHLETLLALGNAHFHVGDYAQAAAAYELALTAHPEAAAALNNLAQVYVESARWQEAAALLTRARALDGPFRAQVEETWRELKRRKPATH